MPRTACLSLGFLATALLLCPVPAGRAEDRKPGAVRILLLGDSTVIGSVCRWEAPRADYLEDVIRKLLAAEPDLPPMEVINQGRDGESVHGLLSGRYDRDIAKLPRMDFCQGFNVHAMLLDESFQSFYFSALLDDAVGSVPGKLRSTGLEEQTLVFFLSDNGGPIGKFAPNGSRNTPLRGSKGDTWEGGIRVPFLMQWKGRLPVGKVYTPPVIQLDIHPTALAVAGVQGKSEWHLDGVNLLPFLDGKEERQPHPALYWRFGEQMASRRGDWKLVRADLATGLSMFRAK